MLQTLRWCGCVHLIMQRLGVILLKLLSNKKPIFRKKISVCMYMKMHLAGSSRGLPGHPDAKIGGAAVRWRLRRGAGSLYSCRSSSYSSLSKIYRPAAGSWRDAREWRDA
jgi:hypothetical protein